MRATLLVLTIALAGNCLHAQDLGLYWKYKDYDGAVSFSVPRMIIHIGSWFLADKSDRELLRKVRKVRVLVFDNNDSPVTDADLQHFVKKAAKRGLEELVSVRDRDTKFWVYARERGDAVRKIVVISRSPKEFALVTIRGNFQYDDIGELVSRLVKRSRQEKQGAPGLNTLVKIPSTIRI